MNIAQLREIDKSNMLQLLIDFPEPWKKDIICNMNKIPEIIFHILPFFTFIL